MHNLLRGDKMDAVNNTCDNLAKILNGKGKFDNGICMVTVERHNINATIGNKLFRSLTHMFNFESPDSNGNYLITGEMVLLENEVPEVVSDLTNSGIIVSAIHTHWLFDTPRLVYIHLEAIMNPVNFATKLAQILKGKV